MLAWNIVKFCGQIAGLGRIVIQVMFEPVAYMWGVCLHLKHVGKCTSEIKSIKQIRPSIIGLQRDPSPHETFSDLQQRYNQRVLLTLLL